MARYLPSSPRDILQVAAEFPSQSLRKLICARGSLWGSEGENCPSRHQTTCAASTHRIIHSECMAKGSFLLHVHWPGPAAVPVCSSNISAGSQNQTGSASSGIFCHLCAGHGICPVGPNPHSGCSTANNTPLVPMVTHPTPISRGSKTGGAEARGRKGSTPAMEI